MLVRSLSYIRLYLICPLLSSRYIWLDCVSFCLNTVFILLYLYTYFFGTIVVVAVLLRVICNNVKNLLYFKTSLHLCRVFASKVFGVSLSQQELGSDGIPHLVAKCLQFVETYGM